MKHHNYSNKGYVNRNIFSTTSLLMVLVAFIIAPAMTAMLLPQTTHAAPPASAAIVQGSSSECEARIAGPSTGYLQSLPDANAFRITTPSDATPTFDAISRSENRVYITFAGVGNDANFDCGITMRLVQDTSNRTQFHGFWHDRNTLAVHYQSATVNPGNGSGTVTFTIPNLSGANSFTLNVGGDTSLFSETHFPSGSGGGGSGGAGSCNLFSPAYDACWDAYTPTFTDAATIMFAGEEYRASHWGGNPMRYVLVNSPNPTRQSVNVNASNCTPAFELDTNPANNQGLDLNIDGDGGENEIREFFTDGLSAAATSRDNLKFINYDSSCNQSEGELEAMTSGIMTFAGYYPSTDTIQVLFVTGGGNESPFIQSYARTSDTEFTATSAAVAGCSDTRPMFRLGSNPASEGVTAISATWRLQASDTNPRCAYIDGSVMVAVMSGTPPTVGGSNADTPLENINSCENNGGSMSWILCPILEMMDGVLSWLDSAITNVLEVPEDYFARNGSVHNAWRNIRNIAFIVLVPILLVMVIGTAMGFSFIDAYTVKRAMPRFVVAVIFIALSWEITSFLLTITNDVGRGIKGLIESPFSGGAEITLASIFNPSGGNAAALGLTAVIAGTAALGAINIGVLLSFAFVAVLGLLTGFVLLSLRQMLLIMLALLAPLAILAWIFPGNDRLWKLWWGTFSKLLLMFPLVMLLISAGRAFAVIISLSDTSPVSTLLKLVAYVGPFFMIKMTFTVAGGIFGTLTGMVDNKEKGLFDRQRKYRGEAMAKTRENAGNNRRFNPEGKLGRLNKLAGWGASPVANAKVGIGKGRIGQSAIGKRLGLNNVGADIMGGVNQAQVEQTGKIEQKLQQLGVTNDRALRGLAGISGLSDEQGKIGPVRTSADLNRTIAALRSTGDANDALAAQQLDSNLVHGLVAGAWKDPDLQKGSIEGAALIGASRQGFVNGADIANVANQLLVDNKADEGFAAQIANTAALAGYSQGGRLDLKPGSGVHMMMPDNPDEDKRRFKGGLQGNPDAQMKLAQTLKVSNWMGAKPKSITEMKDGIKMLSNMDTFEGQAMRDAVLQGASQFSSSDPSSKARWKEIIAEMDSDANLSENDERSMAFQLRQLDMRRGASQGTGRESGGAATGGGSEA